MPGSMVEAATGVLERSGSQADLQLPHLYELIGATQKIGGDPGAADWGLGDASSV